MGARFARFAQAVSDRAGSPWVFLLAVLVVVAWAVAGPFLGFSDLWQLAINTGTTIVTFLMTFLILNASNRDTAAIKAMIRQMVDDLPDVDAAAVAAKLEEDQP